MENENSNMTYEYYVNGELKARTNSNEYTQEVELENKEPYLPSGFRHTTGDVNNGYVIRDTSNGNEFVWVPVGGKNYTIYVKASDGKNINLQSNEIDVAVSGLTRTINGYTYDNWYEEEGDINDKKSIAYFKKSVAENSGFYMGRYEMGMPNQQSGDEPVLAFSREARNVSGVPVCVANVMPWNYIDWSTAKANLESMYNGEVQSAMMNSYARTTTLNWFVNSGAKTIDELRNSSESFGIYAPMNDDVTSIFKGYYYDSYNNFNYAKDYTSIMDLYMRDIANILIATGANTNPSNRNAINKIFDLAGNTEEWTTEKLQDSEEHRLSGGSFQASSRYSIIDGANYGFENSGTTGSITTSSRPILYK